MENKANRIKELVKLLNSAREAYYVENTEIISNFEYDRLEKELEELEKETGIVLSSSPTRNVGGSLASDLPKLAHKSPMLSLAKTKEVAELVDFLKFEKAIISWKMDGLTVAVSYENGELTQAVTRGNGQVGELITENAKMFTNLPIKIPFEGEITLRGEAIITYSQFEKINAQIEDTALKYKNPRNLCSGSVRQLDSSITKKRGVEFHVFSIASVSGKDFQFHSEELEFARSLGFEVVDYKITDAVKVEEDIREFERKIAENDFPSDGLVIRLDDIKYGKTLGTTGKYPKDALAFKWRDEIAETVLKEVEWSASRTGLINPIAIFDAVELEGTTVSRASLHNISILRELKLGIGDRITVYKANMIIPQIAENLSCTDNLELPSICPSCKGKSKLKNENGVSVLICENPACPAKQIKAFTHFVSRNALNIEGISEAILEKMIDRGFISEFADIFKLREHKSEIIEMEGFGEKSFEKMINAVEAASKTTISRLILALGIPNIGEANAKNIAKHFKGDLACIMQAGEEEFSEIDGVGKIMAEGIYKFFRKSENIKMIEELLKVLEFEEVYQNTDAKFEGKTFVITGSLEKFENRAALKEVIELSGGKVSGSVSNNTDYLINNDAKSNSSKNKKAKEIGISIISEDEFLEMINS